MFSGFDPDQGQTFFERKRWQSMLGALLLVGGSLASAFYVASIEPEEPIEEEIIEAEIANFEIEEALEEEPEPEPEPPPPPSDSKPVKRSKKPTPAPQIVNPDSIDDNPEEGDVSTEGPGYGEGGGTGTGTGTGTGEPEPEPKKPEPAAEKPKKKPAKKKSVAINPDKPVERPPGATAVKQTGGNAPVYPAELKKRNITGKVKVRLIIYKDGSVKGATVLAKSNSVDKDADPELYAQANKLLLKAVQKSLPTWTFKPSMYEGTPITVYLTITIPFSLN